jgi:TonB family protein
VMNVRVVQPAGYGFDEAAAEAIKKSKFKPAYINDQPVPVRIRLPIRFKLIF